MYWTLDAALIVWQSLDKSIWDKINREWQTVRHDYLYITSPGGDVTLSTLKAYKRLQWGSYRTSGPCHRERSYCESVPFNGCSKAFTGWQKTWFYFRMVICVDLLLVADARWLYRGSNVSHCPRERERNGEKKTSIKLPWLIGSFVCWEVPAS